MIYTYGSPSKKKNDWVMYDTKRQFIIAVVGEMPGIGGRPLTRIAAARAGYGYVLKSYASWYIAVDRLCQEGILRRERRRVPRGAPRTYYYLAE